MGKRAIEYASMVSPADLENTAAKVCSDLLAEVYELTAARKAVRDEARASAVMDVYKKACAIGRILAKEGIDPKCVTSAFATLLCTVNEKLYKLWMTEVAKIASNRKLLKLYPVIAAQPEGFKKMHEAMKDGSGKLWRQLLHPSKKSLRKHHSEGVINMVHRNVRLYWVDPALGGTGEPIYD